MVADNPMTVMEATVQRVLIWSGTAFVVVWLGAFILLAGFIPPPAPSLTAQEIFRFYSSNTGSIKLGLVISMAGCALLVPFGVAISGQLKRIDGARALADVQMVSCALLSLEFITPIGVWMAASYRLDGRSPEMTQTVNDIGWILFMTVIWSLWVQLIAIAIAILIDRNAEPVLPRWLGYLSLWTSMLIIPAGIILFFRSGPFAWNGVVGLYVPLVGYCIWIAAMTTVVHRSLTKRIADGDQPGLPRHEFIDATGGASRA